MDRRSFSCALAAGYFALALTPLQSQEAKQEWGNLSATFVYDGEPPEPRKLKIDKDKDVIKEPLFDQSLVVDSKTKGVANVVTWLFRARDAKPPAVHPEYESLAALSVKLDVRDHQLQPRITTLLVNQKLEIHNHDPIGYGLMADLFANNPQDMLMPAQGKLTRVFSRALTTPGLPVPS